MPARVSVSWLAARAMPKSETRIVSSAARRRFAGLTSRWTIPRACATSSAAPASSSQRSVCSCSGRAGPEALGERAPGRVLHDDEGEPVLVLADVVDRDDERLARQARRHLSLAHEAGLELLVLAVALGQHLDRHRATEDPVLRPNDVSHAAVRDRLPVCVARRKRGPIPRHLPGVPPRARANHRAHISMRSSQPFASATAATRSRSGSASVAAEACAPRRARSSRAPGSRSRRGAQMKSSGSRDRRPCSGRDPAGAERVVARTSPRSVVPPSLRESRRPRGSRTPRSSRWWDVERRLRARRSRELERS